MGCLLVHVSTDYVFGADRHRKIPYREDDLTQPVNVYGKSKAEGEILVQQYPKHLLVRTCGLYTSPSASGQHHNFVSSMLRAAKQRTQLRVVDDQYCTPTYVPHLAHAIGQLIACQGRGIYHITNTGEATWYAFAKEIFRIVEMNPQLMPISTSEYGALAPRPQYSILNMEKYEFRTTVSLASWKEALSECLRDKL